MKPLTSLLFMLTLLGNALAGETDKAYASYRIDSTKFEASLNESETRFSFKFHWIPFDPQIEIIYAYNGIEERTHLDSNCRFNLFVPKGKYKFIFYIDQNYLEVYTDSIQGNSRTINYISIFPSPSKYEIEVDKPVLYFYPQTSTEIIAKVHPAEPFTFTYPTYKDSWSFTANHEGSLKIDNKELNYLFWESRQQINLNDFNLSYGSIIDKENVTSFLESSLTAFGFTDQEKEDFITYWGPQMIRHEKCFIQFLMNEQCDQFATMEITPKPDKTYRFYALILPVRNGSFFDIAPQSFEKMDRSGFTVLEWGGFIIDDILKEI